MTEPLLLEYDGGIDAERRRRGLSIFQGIVAGDFPIHLKWKWRNHDMEAKVRTITLTHWGDPEFDVDYLCDGEELPYSKPLILVNWPDGEDPRGSALFIIREYGEALETARWRPSS